MEKPKSEMVRILTRTVLWLVAHASKSAESANRYRSGNIRVCISGIAIFLAPLVKLLCRYIKFDQIFCTTVQKRITTNVFRMFRLYACHPLLLNFRHMNLFSNKKAKPPLKRQLGFIC